MNAATEEIEKIREVRRKISALCGNDPYRLVNRYITRAQKRDQEHISRKHISKVNETPAGD
jgi:hypothetical protein